MIQCSFIGTQAQTGRYDILATLGIHLCSTILFQFNELATGVLPIFIRWEYLALERLLKCYNNGPVNSCALYMFSSDDLSTNNRTHTPTYGLLGGGRVCDNRRAQEIGIQIICIILIMICLLCMPPFVVERKLGTQRNILTHFHIKTQKHTTPPFIYSKTHSYWRWMFLVSTHNGVEYVLLQGEQKQQQQQQQHPEYQKCQL